MNYKLFIILIVLGTVLSLVNSVMIIINFDPFQVGILGLVVFYLSMFLVLAGLFFLLANLVGEKFFAKPKSLMRLKASLRHGVMFSILILGWAFMTSQDILRWWNLLLLILILTVLEFLFISLERERKTISYEGENQSAPGTVQPSDQADLINHIPGRIGN